MAHLLRLIVAALLLLFTAQASAVIPTSTYYATRTHGSSSGTATGFYSTKEGAAERACQSYNNFNLSNVGGVCMTSAQGGTTASIFWDWGQYCCGANPADKGGVTVYVRGSGQSAYSVSFSGGWTTSQQCPANSTSNGSGGCTCSAGYQENAGQTACELIPPPNNCTGLTGKSAGTYNLLVGANESRTGMKQLCITSVSSGDPALSGCLATGESTFAWEHDGSTFVLGMAPGWYSQAMLAYTGTKCNPDPNGSTSSGSPAGSGPVPGSGTEDGKTTQCPVGKVPGEVNGVTICVTPGTDTPQEAKKATDQTEQKADGTSVSKTTTVKTVCDEKVCVTTTTTTTITTPPGGSPTTTNETSTSTCVVGSPDCTAKAGVGGGGGGGGAGDGTDPSSFGGSCTAAFKCSGDAIMCAVSLEQHKRNCALFVDSSPESLLYGSEKGKTGAQYTSENVTISSSSFNSSNAFGGSAQCIQDKTLTVWGTEVVVPLSNVCGTLAHLGTLLMTVSFLLAFRIVARG